jgi:hypothetical protein
MTLSDETLKKLSYFQFSRKKLGLGEAVERTESVRLDSLPERMDQAVPEIEEYSFDEPIPLELFDIDWGKKYHEDLSRPNESFVPKQNEPADDEVSTLLDTCTTAEGTVADDTTVSVGVRSTVNPPEPPKSKFLGQCIDYLNQQYRYVIESSIVESRVRKHKQSSTVTHFVLELEYHPVMTSQYFQIPVEDIVNDLMDGFISAYQYILEETLSMVVPKDHIFLTMYPSFLLQANTFNSLLLWIQNLQKDYFYQFHGIVTSIALPRFVNKGYYYQCENPKCNNKNVLHIVNWNNDFELYKRDSLTKSLGVTCKSSIHVVDLKCNHCNKDLKESVCNGLQMIEQFITVYLLDNQGYSITGM